MYWIVLEQGYKGLSARKVARAIGYTVGTLYLVFENLDDLIRQINGRTLDRLHCRMAEAQASCGDVRECLLQLGQTYIRFAAEDTHRWTMMFEHRYTEAKALPDWYEAKITSMLALVEECIKPLATHRSEAEIALAARALWGGMHGICILALTDKLGVVGIDSVHDFTQSLMSNYLKGFTGD